MSNIASIFIDVSYMKKSIPSAKRGLSILTEYKEGIINQIGEHSYLYNLSNAKSGLIAIQSPFEHNFSTIEQLVEIKFDLWKALKLFKGENNKNIDPTYTVNLGNSLKQQFRIAEAIDYYDLVNSLNLDIPQAWINRSETLMMLNQVSNTFSIQLLVQVRDGYNNVLSSSKIPPAWVEEYKNQIKSHQQKLTVLVKK